MDRLTPAQQAKVLALQQKKEAQGKIVVMVDGVYETGIPFREFVQDAKDIRTELTRVLKGAHLPGSKINELIDGLMSHPVSIVKGTNALRRFNYVKQISGTVTVEGKEVHHWVPLWLGGDHKKEFLVALDPDVHDKIHQIFNKLKTIDKKIKLTPSSLHSEYDDEMKPGVAVISPDGGIEMKVY